MTVKEAYTKGTEMLEAAGIAESSLDAWYLLEHLTGMTRAKYFMDANQNLEEAIVSEYLKMIGERSTHIPLQHITGEQEFMGLTFLVNDQVLIPRQDTELLVEQAMKVLSKESRVLDMCTGSGCIIISLEHYAKEKRLQGFAGLGVDISEGALEVAKNNAKKMDSSVKFVQSNLFEAVDGKFDLIISNPPYIRTDEIAKLEEEVKIHDPFLALDGKEDGLFFYRKIVSQAGSYLKPKGWLIVEIGFDQGSDVSQLFEQAGFTAVQVKKDLAGLDRVVLGVYDKERVF